MNADYQDKKYKVTRCELRVAGYGLRVSSLISISYPDNLCSSLSQIYKVGQQLIPLSRQK